MSLRRRIFIAFILTLVVGGTGLGLWVRGEARDSYAYVVEEMLVDVSNLLAVQIQQDRDVASDLSHLKLPQWMEAFQQRKVEAHILKYIKTKGTLGAYVTDANGIVIYHSRDAGEVGKNYSQWRDVARALAGGHGSRSSRLEQSERSSSFYYVATPIFVNGKIAGVVSVFKPRTSITGILNLFFGKILFGAFIGLLVVIGFGGLLVLWITHPIERLKTYALAVSDGRKVPLPQFSHRELRQLADAFEHMRISVEGRKTIEKFIQSLTHELKSPLTAMRGSAELSLEPMDSEKRERFLKNIVEEAGRAELVLEQMLRIAALESQTALSKVETVNVTELLAGAQNALVGIAHKNQVSFISDSESSTVSIEGDDFLLTQAFRNLLQNGLEFSARGGSVKTRVVHAGDRVQIQVEDQGSGIPPFARERIFEKFYSLERPRTGKKGTGLGLNFVREVIHLHRGEISVTSPLPELDHGTLVEITLPIQQ